MEPSLIVLYLGYFISAPGCGISTCPELQVLIVFLSLLVLVLGQEGSSSGK